MANSEIDSEPDEQWRATVAACTIGGLALEGGAIISVTQSAIGERLAGIAFAGVGAIALAAASRTYFENKHRALVKGSSSKHTD